MAHRNERRNRASTRLAIIVATTIAADMHRPAQADSGLDDLVALSLFEATLEVVEGCRIDSTGGSGFGTLDFGTHAFVLETLDQDLTLSLAIDCTAGTDLRVRIDGGLHGSVGNRRMQRDGDTDTLGYELYTDSARTIVWDDLDGLQLVSDGDTKTVTVHGRIPPQAGVAAGTYRDTLQVTITY